MSFSRRSCLKLLKLTFCYKLYLCNLKVIHILHIHPGKLQDPTIFDSPMKQSEIKGPAALILHRSKYKC